MRGSPRPVVDTLHPVRGSATPVVDTLHPVTGSPTPVVDTLHPVRGSPTPVVDTLHPVRGSPRRVVDTLNPVRGSLTPVVDTLHPVAQIAKKRDKSGGMTSPQPLTKYDKGSEYVLRIMLREYVFLNHGGANQTVEDLRGRHTAVTVTEHAKKRAR